MYFLELKMSEIEGSNPKISESPTPNYDFNPEQTTEQALLIQAFNRIKDSFDTNENSSEFGHQVNCDCGEFKGLYEYLLGPSHNQKTEKCSDIIDLLLNQLSSPTVSTDDCLKTLHKVTKTLPNVVSEKLKQLFQKIT